jgi:hypothetical protein
VDRLSVVSCGHPPPLHLCRDGRSELPDLPANLPLGLGSTFAATELPWSPGDRLLLYTDGLSEARDLRGRFLPVQPLAQVIAGPPLGAALDGLIAAVQEHVPGAALGDDLAVLLLENLGAAAHSSASGSAEAASEAAVVWGEGRSSPRSAGASGMRVRSPQPGLPVVERRRHEPADLHLQQGAGAEAGEHQVVAGHRADRVVRRGGRSAHPLRRSARATARRDVLSPSTDSTLT